MLSKNNPENTSNPSSTPPYPYQDPEEDEINLFNCLLTLLKYKGMIFLMVMISGILAVFISLRMPNIYRSEATITLRESDNSVPSFGALGGLGGMVASQFGIGGSGTLEKLEVVSRSRELSARVINKYNLMPVLFPDSWNYKKKQWRVEDPPTLQDGIKKINNLLSVHSDLKKNILTIGFENEDPEIAKNIVDYYLIELSGSLREEVIRDSTENLKFFEEQLKKTNDALLREKIYALIAKEIEKETFAKAQKYYGFLLIDPPIVPDLDKKANPNRRSICIFWVFVTFFGAIFIAFFLEFFKKMKVQDRLRFQQIMDGLKIFRFSTEKIGDLKSDA